MSENKDLKTIDDALNSGALNENDVFEFDSATVEIIFGAAERMATMIKILQELNKTMQATYDNLEARIEFLHEANITLQAVDSQRLEELSEQTRKNEYWITQLNDEAGRADCLEAEVERLKAELEKRPEVVRCGECKHKEWCRKSINKDGHGDMCPLSFCSAGQSRESEEGK